MQTHLQILAALTRIDIELADIQEELGDLPLEVKHLERDVRNQQQSVDATREQLQDVHRFRSDLRIRIQEIHDKEKRLGEQQFQVRNNREFDAITHEVEAIKNELREIERELTTSALTEENLSRILAGQEEELSAAKERLSEKEQELVKLSGDHDEEMTSLLNKRTDLMSQLPQSLIVQYERIRELHINAAVVVRRGSCSGCFNAIPPQKLVEIRAYKQIFTCESCGRMLFPEDMPGIA
jgi:predicted  nucleic acid-binding Zn-ribbon protein